MNKCTKCEVKIDDHRFHLGYTECVDCSETEKYSAHTVYPHKTGGYIQPVKKSQSDDLKRMDRRSTSGGRTAKGIYADQSWDRWLEQYWHNKYNPKPKKKRVVKAVKINYIPKDIVVKDVMAKFNSRGYNSAVDLLTTMYQEDKISLITKSDLTSRLAGLQMLTKKQRKYLAKLQ